MSAAGKAAAQRVGVYGGSFDPVTRGHLWMIREGARLFDRLIVAVGVNPQKRYLFDVTERQAMLEESLPVGLAVEVDHFTGQYLVNYARDRGASFILRGLRSAHDLSFEHTLRHINADIAERTGPDSPPPTTVFLMPPRELAEVSSGLIKGLVRADPDWPAVVGQYVPDPVVERFRAYDCTDEANGVRER